MWIFVNVAMLVFATLIAGAAAVSVYWLLLRATLQLMRPATIRTGVGRTGPDPAFATVPTLFKEGSK